MKSNPPKLGLWMLQHVCPGSNEELIGDLLETYAEGRSKAWFWRQVLIAIAVGTLRLRPHLVYAITGTIMLAAIGRTLSQSHLMMQLWVWSRGLQSPLQHVVFICQSTLLGLLVLPLWAGVLRLNHTFGWLCFMRTGAISIPLFLIGDLLTFVWSHPAMTGPQAWMLAAFGLSRVFLTLLLSAFVANVEKLESQ